jgi:hypothetical protein
MHDWLVGAEGRGDSARPEQPEQPEQVGEQAAPRMSRGWIAPEQSGDAD